MSALSYNVDGAAEALGTDAETVKQLVALQAIRSFRFRPHGKLLIAATDLEAFRRSNPNAAAKLAALKAIPPKPSKPLPKCGVYLLLVEGAVVYVGRSVAMAKRIDQHRAAGRVFDRVEAIPCDLPTSVWLERELIRVHRPGQNLVLYTRHSSDKSADLARVGLR